MLVSVATAVAAAAAVAVAAAVAAAAVAVAAATIAAAAVTVAAAAVAVAAAAAAAVVAAAAAVAAVAAVVAAAALAALAAVAVVAPAVLAALDTSTAAKTSAAWLARRTPRPQALPSPTGLCAGPPAGRPPDGVRTTQLLGTRAGGLRCDAQAGPCQACSRRSSCALATGLLLVLRARMPAPPPAFGEDGGRAARQWRRYTSICGQRR